MRITVELIPATGMQTLTKYRARNHDIYIGHGADYQDPHTNADTFAATPTTATLDVKSLAWRNAWRSPT
jgi:peptide/nickel transport system substrate-binding protein